MIEMAVATVSSVLLIGAGVLLVSASGDAANSTIRTQTVQTRADRAIWPVVRDIRRGSLATLQQLDGTTFDDGTTGTGLSMVPVTGWDGAALTGDRFTYWLAIDAGETTGELMRSQTGMPDRVIASNVTDFTITRTDQRLVVTLSVRTGPDDHRGRAATATVEINPRNP